MVEKEVWFAVETPAPIAAEGSTATQPTRPKRPKILKLERKGSSPRERSRSRVRSVLKKCSRCPKSPDYPYHNRRNL